MLRYILLYFLIGETIGSHYQIYTEYTDSQCVSDIVGVRVTNLASPCQQVTCTSTDTNIITTDGEFSIYAKAECVDADSSTEAVSSMNMAPNKLFGAVIGTYSDSECRQESPDDNIYTLSSANYSCEHQTNDNEYQSFSCSSTSVNICRQYGQCDDGTCLDKISDIPLQCTEHNGKYRMAKCNHNPSVPLNVQSVVTTTTDIVSPTTQIEIPLNPAGISQSSKDNKKIDAGPMSVKHHYLYDVISIPFVLIMIVVSRYCGMKNKKQIAYQYVTLWRYVSAFSLYGYCIATSNEIIYFMFYPKDSVILSVLMCIHYMIEYFVAGTVRAAVFKDISKMSNMSILGISLKIVSILCFLYQISMTLIFWSLGIQVAWTTAVFNIENAMSTMDEYKFYVKALDICSKVFSISMVVAVSSLGVMIILISLSFYKYVLSLKTKKLIFNKNTMKRTVLVIICLGYTIAYIAYYFKVFEAIDQNFKDGTFETGDKSGNILTAHAILSPMFGSWMSWSMIYTDCIYLYNIEVNKLKDQIHAEERNVKDIEKAQTHNIDTRKRENIEDSAIFDD